MEQGAIQPGQLPAWRIAVGTQQYAFQPCRARDGAVEQLSQLVGQRPRPIGRRLGPRKHGRVILLVVGVGEQQRLQPMLLQALEAGDLRPVIDGAEERAVPGAIPDIQRQRIQPGWLPARRLLNGTTADRHRSRPSRLQAGEA